MDGDCGALHETGGDEVGLNGFRAGDGGDVRSATMEDMKIRHFEGLLHADAVGETSDEGGSDDLGGQIQVGPVRKQRGEGAAVFRLIAPRGCLPEGAEQSEVLRRAVLGEFAAHHQHFFDVAGVGGGAKRRAPAFALLDRERVPWFAGAIAVERAGHKIAKHLGRRDDGDPDVAGRIESRGAQPVEEHHVMGRKRKHDAERESVFPATTEGLGAQGLGVDDARGPETVRERDGVAMEIHHEGGAHVRGRAPESELGGPEDRRGRGGGVEFAEGNFVPHGSPADFARELDAQSVAGEEPEFLRHDERRAIRQRHEAEAERAEKRDFGGGSGDGHDRGILARRVPLRRFGLITALQRINDFHEFHSCITRGGAVVKTAVFDTRQLLAFGALARFGSFTQAAQELHLTQSAISHAIKALEEQAGCRLVERAARRVALTQAGEQLLRHVEKILLEMKLAHTGLQELSRWGHGRLRLGASTTACQYILPTVLREFKQSFPKCVISIEPGNHAEQVELLLQNRIDLALMLEPEATKELTFVPLFTDELRYLVAPAHAWAREGRVLRETWNSETLILYNQVSYTFRIVKDYFQREGLPLVNFMELGSMDAIKELVKIGVGVGVIAPWVAKAELAAGALVSLPLGKRKLRRRWGVAYARKRRLSLGEETFVGLCQTVTEGFEEP